MNRCEIESIRFLYSFDFQLSCIGTEQELSASGFKVLSESILTA